MATRKEMVISSILLSTSAKLALTISLLALFIVSAAAEVMPFSSDRWEIKARESRVEDHLGQDALFLEQGFALVKASADFLKREGQANNT